MTTTQSIASRGSVFGFNVLAYAMGSGSLVYLILTFASVLTPDNAPLFKGPVFDNSVLAVLWNLLLAIGFGYKHTKMASVKFNIWLKSKIPGAMTRGVFMMATAIYLVVMLALWSPLPGVIWQTTGAINYLMIGLFIFGWAFLFIATFMIDHFELFGLKQGYYYLKNRENPELHFVKTGFYAYVRHPIMTGLLIGMWCLPTMTVNLLILSVFFSGYVFVGVHFEELKLKRILGEQYHQYCKEVGCILPKLIYRDPRVNA